MPELFRRMVLSGALTAGMAAVVGFMVAQLMTVWGVAPAEGPRVPNANAGEAFASTLQARLPLRMAALAFVLAAITESVMPLRRVVPAKALPSEGQPDDDAEMLLLELLEQAEAKAAATEQFVNLADNTPASHPQPKSQSTGHPPC